MAPRKGLSNRQKHQGVPVYDESLVTRKRKDAPPAPAEDRPKKRKTDGKGAKKGGKIDTEKIRSKGKPVKPIKSAKKAKTAPAPAIVSDDEIISEDGLSDAIDDLDIEEDGLGGVKVSRLDALGSASEDELDDEFGDSDMVDDSDTEVRRAGIWSDDEDEDVEEKLTAANIEGLSRKLDMERAVEEAEAQAELEEAALQTNIADDKPKVFDDEEEEGGRQITNLGTQDLQLLRTRLTETIRVLDDFKNLAEEGRSRSDYTKQFLKDVCAYYGYSEFLAEKLMNLFPAREAFAFFEANETPRPVVIRTNTLRSHRRELAQSLINRGVQLQALKTDKVGLQIFDAPVPLGATPEYLAGHYILQAASSFLPVIALAPQPGERVLDMASAPGGKTTHMAALMKNTGCIVANDANKARCKGLIGNIHRLGVKNTIVSNENALSYPKIMGGFDRVLLDAPCTGSGVIAKDPSVKMNKTEEDFVRLPHLQKQLILAAIDSVDSSSKTGGFICYSTCSVAVEENEQVVQYALNRRPNVKLVSTGLSFGKEGFTSYMGKTFHPSMKLVRRYYPHSFNIDGFFVAKFQKLAPTPPNAIGANRSGNSNGKVAGKDTEQEYVDKTPITEDEEEESDFGGWDDEEDEKYIELGQRKELRRKGKNPKASPANSKRDLESSDKKRGAEDTKATTEQVDKVEIIEKTPRSDGKARASKKNTAKKEEVSNGTRKSKVDKADGGKDMSKKTSKAKTSKRS